MTKAGRERRRARRAQASAWRKHKIAYALSERLAEGRKTIRLHGAVIPEYQSSNGPMLSELLGARPFGREARDELIMQAFEGALRVRRNW